MRVTRKELLLGAGTVVLGCAGEGGETELTIEVRAKGGTGQGPDRAPEPTGKKGLQEVDSPNGGAHNGGGPNGGAAGANFEAKPVEAGVAPDLACTGAGSAQGQGMQSRRLLVSLGRAGVLWAAVTVLGCKQAVSDVATVAGQGEAASEGLVPADAAESQPLLCEQMELLLTLSHHGPFEPLPGVTVEVLRMAEDERVSGPQPTQQELPPEQWDRAAFPEEACVLRIQGIDPYCFANIGSSVDFGRPQAEIIPPSYWEAQESRGVEDCDMPEPGCMGVAPGHPGADEWWYLYPRQTDTLLIICGSQCVPLWSTAAEARLTLSTSGGGCRSKVTGIRSEPDSED